MERAYLPEPIVHHVHIICKSCAEATNRILFGMPEPTNCCNCGAYIPEDGKRSFVKDVPLQSGQPVYCNAIQKR